MTLERTLGARIGGAKMVLLVGELSKVPAWVASAGQRGCLELKLLAGDRAKLIVNLPCHKLRRVYEGEPCIFVSLE